MEEDKTILNLKPKTKCTGSKSANFSTLPATEDVALAETLLLVPENQSKEVEASDEEIKEAIVYSNGVTSIDFAMPEDEREIIEKNLNMYSNLEQMQKVLNIAKKNKKISEDIKSMELISKSGEVSDLLFDILTDEETITAVKRNIKAQILEGDVMKGYKNLATANKIILDAREEMKKSLNSNGNKKNAKIALKFTNDNGDDFQLGVEV